MIFLGSRSDLGLGRLLSILTRCDRDLPRVGPFLQVLGLLLRIAAVLVRYYRHDAAERRVHGFFLNNLGALVAFT